MTDANLNTVQEPKGFSSGAPETPIPIWEFEGKTYPLFAFDQPCEIPLQNGTVHRFKPWSPTIEKKREDYLKSIVVTSPAVVNGENPVDIKTDYSRSLLYYYEAMSDEVGGVSIDGINQNGSFLKTAQIVPGQITRRGDPARISDLLSPAVS